MLKSRLLGMISYKRTYVRSSNMTKGNEYKIMLSYNGHWAWFTFHDNFETRARLYLLFV